MKTLSHADRAEPKYISVISILLLAVVGYITKLRCMHRECYIFASQNLWAEYIYYDTTISRGGSLNCESARSDIE